MLEDNLLGDTSQWNYVKCCQNTFKSVFLARAKKRASIAEVQTLMVMQCTAC